MGEAHKKIGLRINPLKITGKPTGIIKNMSMVYIRSLTLSEYTIYWRNVLPGKTASVKPQSAMTLTFLQNTNLLTSRRE